MAARNVSPIPERLQAYSVAVPESGCWIWLGAGNQRYGVMRIGDRLTLAHRASYEAYRGPIPEGMQVCHRCDVGMCINPAHLFLGTIADNVRDCINKGRFRANPQNFIPHYGRGRVYEKLRKLLGNTK